MIFREKAATYRLKISLKISFSFLLSKLCSIHIDTREMSVFRVGIHDIRGWE